MIDKDKKIYLAGHNGMVGSAILRKLVESSYYNFVLRNSSELDLRIQSDVNDFFEEERPDIVILAAALVGGINANILKPVEFLYDNLMIQNNVLLASYNLHVHKFIFIGSSCIYPRECQQPIKEEYLLDGKLEPTNEGYALAKICGIKLGEYLQKSQKLNVINLIPCNLYGPNDCFDLETSHVLAALVRKVVDAVENKENSVKLWGTGIARREFMHVDDFAEAVMFFLNKNNVVSRINIGWGKDVSIKELASLIADSAGFKGNFIWDESKPDGMLRKCLDVSLMESYGFTAKRRLKDGVLEMINYYRNIRKNL